MLFSATSEFDILPQIIWPFLGLHLKPCWSQWLYGDDLGEDCWHVTQLGEVKCSGCVLRPAVLWYSSGTFEPLTALSIRCISRGATRLKYCKKSETDPRVWLRAPALGDASLCKLTVLPFRARANRLCTWQCCQSSLGSVGPGLDPVVRNLQRFLLSRKYVCNVLLKCVPYPLFSDRSPWIQLLQIP